MTAKLCDFGVSEKLKEPFDEKDEMVKSAGTYHFFPPECCDPDTENYKGRPTDMWALGVTLYCMMFNQLPFWNSDVNEFGILDIILKSEVTIPSDTSREVEPLWPKLTELLLGLLDKNPETRITSKQLKHDISELNQV